MCKFLLSECWHWEEPIWSWRLEQYIRLQENVFSILCSSSGETENILLKTKLFQTLRPNRPFSEPTPTQKRFTHGCTRKLTIYLFNSFLFLHIMQSFKQLIGLRDTGSIDGETTHIVIPLWNCNSVVKLSLQVSTSMVPMTLCGLIRQLTIPIPWKAITPRWAVGPARVLYGVLVYHQ